MATGALVAGALALSACATTSTTARSTATATATLEANGLSAARISVEGDRSIAIVNSDSRPHQIYSHDCPELSSTVLEPGQSFVMQLGDGPKTCHFQDLLDPLAPEFRGTVDVGPSSRSPVTWRGTGFTYIR
jgi:hypothetical protein